MLDFDFDFDSEIFFFFTLPNSTLNLHCFASLKAYEKQRGRERKKVYRGTRALTPPREAKCNKINEAEGRPQALPGTMPFCSRFLSREKKGVYAHE